MGPSTLANTHLEAWCSVGWTHSGAHRHTFLEIWGNPLHSWEGGKDRGLAKMNLPRGQIT